MNVLFWVLLYIIKMMFNITSYEFGIISEILAILFQFFGNLLYDISGAVMPINVRFSKFPLCFQRYVDIFLFYLNSLSYDFPRLLLLCRVLNLKCSQSVPLDNTYNGLSILEHIFPTSPMTIYGLSMKDAKISL